MRAAIFILAFTMTSSACAQQEPYKAKNPFQQEPLPPGAIMRLGNAESFNVGSGILLGFTKGGKTIISCGGTCAIGTWDVASGTQTFLVPEPVKTRGVGYDAKRELVAALCGDGTARVWRLQSGEELLRVRVGSCPVAFSPVGDVLAFNKDGISIWGLAATREKKRLEAPKKQFERLRFSPDGRWLAGAGGKERGIFVWNTRTWKLHKKFTAGESRTYCYWPAIALSPDGKYLVASRWTSFESAPHHQYVLCLIEVETGNVVSVASGHENDHVMELEFFPDGRTVVSTAFDHTIRLWKLEKADKGLLRFVGEAYRTYKHPHMPWGISVSSNGSTIAFSCSANTIHILDVASGKEQHQINRHDGKVLSVAFSEDGQVVASGGTDHRVMLWDVATGKRVFSHSSHKSPVWSVALSKDKTAVASGSGTDIRGWISGGKKRRPDSKNDVISVWDVPGRKRLAQLEGHSHIVWSLDFSPDGKKIVSADPDGDVRVWDISTGKTVNKPLSGGRYVSYTSDGTKIVSANSGGGYSVYDVRSEKNQTCRSEGFPNYSKTPCAVSTPDGRVLLVGHYLEQTKVIETATGKDIWRFDPTIGCDGVVISPNGRFIVLWCSTRIQLLDVYLRKAVHEINIGEAMAKVSSLALSQDGTSLATGMTDGTVLIWNVPEKVCRPNRPEPASSDDLPGLWNNLAGNNAGEAYNAACKLSSTGDEAVGFIEGHILAEPAEKAAEKLVSDLDDEDIQVRETAFAGLEKLGGHAERALRRALEGEPSAEVKERAETLIWNIDRHIVRGREAIRVMRAINVLEHIGSEKARTLLSKLATDAPWSRECEEAKAALERLRTTK